MALLQGKQLADEAITEAKLNTSVAGDGLAGGNGTALAVQLEAAGAGAGGLVFDAGEIRVNLNDGLALTASGIDIALATNSGLTFNAGELEADVDGARGLSKDASGIFVLLQSNGGLAFNTGFVEVDAGDGLATGVGGLVISLAGTSGLEFVTGDLAVNAGNGITVTASGVEVDPDGVTGGDTAPVTVGANGVGVDVTALDGDHLDIDFTPTNYTPDAAVAEAADVDDLAAHLNGIDAALGNVAAATMTEQQENPTSLIDEGSTGATGITMDAAAAGSVSAYINGQKFRVGDGVTTEPFWFEPSGGGAARSFGSIQQNDELHFSGPNAEMALATTDNVDLVYET